MSDSKVPPMGSALGVGIVSDIDGEGLIFTIDTH